MALLGDGIADFARIEELSARLTGTVPVVVVLGPTAPTRRALHRRARHAAYPMLATILVVDELSTSLLKHAMRCGVRDVLNLDGEADPLAPAVQRLAVTLDQGTRSSGSMSVGEQVVDGPPAQLEEVNGQVLTVFSTKGGSGKSVLSTSLAAVLAQRSDNARLPGRRRLQFGDVAVMLKLAPHHTIVDAVSVLDGWTRRCSTACW